MLEERVRHPHAGHAGGAGRADTLGGGKGDCRQDGEAWGQASGRPQAGDWRQGRRQMGGRRPPSARLTGIEAGQHVALTACSDGFHGAVLSGNLRGGAHQGALLVRAQGLLQQAPRRGPGVPKGQCAGP